MSGYGEKIVDEAAGWYAASCDDQMDWDGFTIWLEADPRHRLAYDEMAQVDMLLQDRAGLLTANENAAEPDYSVYPAVSGFFAGGWTRWAGGAIAASLVAVLITTQLMPTRPETFSTGRESRTIALADGSTVLLAPNSKLTIEGAGQQKIALNGGAWFDIRHDPARQMVVTAGGLEISDIGTKFDVQATSGNVRIEVGEGRVNVSAASLAKPIELSEQRSLSFNGHSRTISLAAISDANIGEWRSGRLSYDSAPLAVVTGDLARYAGVKIIVSDTLKQKKFSGTLFVGDSEAALRDLSLLMDARLSHDSGSYRLSER